ncbi:helix-turn-helix transcriptional regulator [Fodinibius sp. AD559]|uniref:helix-turn-helix transcriptional regulator n=1 Tax=Fodinibius sp. AD559 TaxID=3424179 RepID=UPI0040469536
MNNKERWAIGAILFIIAVLASVDIYNDYFEGVETWHISIEAIVAFVALAGVFYLIRGRFRLQRTLAREQQFSKDLQVEAQKWKRVSKKYMEGLSVEIDNQLDRWGLTKAEKDVTFLLLKGLSNKEIAEVRGTSVQTVRTQTNAIYRKSGLSGRSELSAFFLEDLLLPKQ